MSEYNILLTTSISLAFIHTIISVDHYIPFIILSRTNNWTARKTMLVVFICSLGHVLSSVTLGLFGILLSAGVSLPVNIENIRGIIATYFLFAFGFAYTVFGIIRAVKNKPHHHAVPGGENESHAEHAGEHSHSRIETAERHSHNRIETAENHSDSRIETAESHSNSRIETAENHSDSRIGTAESHSNSHIGMADEYNGGRAYTAGNHIGSQFSRDDRAGHIRARAKDGKTGNVFWGLFVLMVLCPCEPLIPILMYPAASYNVFALVSVTMSFAVCTVATMLAVTFLGLRGIRFIKLDKLERYSHVIAGMTILACGAAVMMLPA